MSTPLRIVVPASDVVRCKWCGTLESHSWISDKDGVYCSKDCMVASGLESIRTYLICFVLLLAVMSFLPLAYSIYSSSLILGQVSTFFLIIISGFQYLKGQRIVKMIPEGSRYDGVSVENYLLKKIKHIECPNCDANLDIREIGPDMVYTCEYCNATGRIEVIHEG